jgi:hypothetical protein
MLHFYIYIHVYTHTHTRFLMIRPRSHSSKASRCTRLPYNGRWPWETLEKSLHKANILYEATTQSTFENRVPPVRPDRLCSAPASSRGGGRKGGGKGSAFPSASDCGTKAVLIHSPPPPPFPPMPPPLPSAGNGIKSDAAPVLAFLCGIARAKSREFEGATAAGASADLSCPLAFLR